ncbi:FluC/FEX family fluoride channel [Brachybacterium sp. DNPG3]
MTPSPPPGADPRRRDDPRMHTVEMAALRFSDLDDAGILGSGPAQPSLTARRTALLVALGGGIGAMLRGLIAIALPAVQTPTLVQLPHASLLVSVLGCLILGGLNGVLDVRRCPAWTVPLLGTGLCGGFTTVSGVVLEGSAMIGADFPILAFIYAMLTIVLCLAAIVLGMLAGRRLGRRLGRGPGRDAGRGRRAARPGTAASGSAALGTSGTGADA